MATVTVPTVTPDNVITAIAIGATTMHALTVVFGSTDVIRARLVLTIADLEVSGHVLVSLNTCHTLSLNITPPVVA